MVLISVHLACAGQYFNFRNFDASSGLPERIVNTVGQDSEGFLWVGGGSGLYRFDGYEFIRTEFPDSQSARFVTASHLDSREKLWLGTNDGRLYYTEGSRLIELPGLEMRFVADIKEDAAGNISILSRSDGIALIPAGGDGAIRHLSTPSGLFFFSFHPVGSDLFYVGTDETLLLLAGDGDDLIIRAESRLPGYPTVNGITEAGGNIYAGTDQGLFFVGEKEGEALPVTRLEHPLLSDINRIVDLIVDRNGDLWVPTNGHGIARISYDRDGSVARVRMYNTLNGLPGNDVRSLFHDREGNHWISLFGDGLSQLVSEAFRFIRPGGETGDNSVIYIGSAGSEKLLGTPSGYYLFDLESDSVKRFFSIAPYTGDTPDTSYHIDDMGNLFVGTDGSGLYSGTSGGELTLLHRGQGGGARVNHIAARPGQLWLSTRNGVIVTDPVGGSTIAHFTTVERLPHNNVNQVFFDRYGSAFVATEAMGLYRMDMEQGVIPEIELEGVGRNIIQSGAITEEGDIWLASLGNGLFHIEDDRATLFTVDDGLPSNFCYSLHVADDERVWIGHERGFSRYNIAGETFQSFSTSFAGGGNCNPNATFGVGDMVFIGTTEGLIIYDGSKDVAGQTAPVNRIVSVTINGERVEDITNINLPYGRYMVNIKYTGIALSNPAMVRYRTYLENYDLDWTPFSGSREVSYILTDGSYSFNIESINEAGLSSLTNEIISISVRRPFWARWWFFLLSAALLAGLIVVVVRYRESKQRELREYLERELQMRTVEVVRQKEEIEHKNSEITDSINYARRIQSSILPDEAKLRETFKDGFIIFIPRDIVSGDFYWYERVSEEKFILVCADSTGHGVPGAFMSMIGSTLLQDIIVRKGITRPSEILALLDEQVFSTLNRNVEVGVSNDGMDVVVCEIDVSTRHLRFASAMRPVILVMDGEMYYIKGNRSSVGGEAYMEKFYDDQEYYLNEGDSIYLFSDGLPDQFGGDDGKKMKIVRLKKLIEGIKEMPMERQKDYISNFFFDWKGDHEQIDDVIFMGVRF